jgi:hypothetical protein
VPNVAFAEPYAHLPQPQQNVAIIGGYAVRNIQIIAVIQTNANQMGEGNANIAYELMPSPSTTGTIHRRSGAILL